VVSGCVAWPEACVRSADRVLESLLDDPGKGNVKRRLRYAPLYFQTLKLGVSKFLNDLKENSRSSQ
jgi:hypothetical protein